MLFTKEWFKKYQRYLLWLCNTPFIQVWFRYILRIHGERSAVGKRSLLEIGPSFITWAEGDHFATEIRTNNKYSLRIFHAFYPIWVLFHIWDTLFANRFFPQYNLGFDSLTVYPDAGTGSTTTDGYVSYYGSKVAWSTIRGSGSGTNAVTNSSPMYAGSVASDITQSNTWDYMARGFFSFDTSHLTSGGTVLSATFSLYRDYIYTISGGDNTLHVTSSTQASANSLSTDDYDQIGRTSFGSIDAVNWTSAYCSISLNASGIANINKTGVSKFSTQTGPDLNNSMPTWNQYTQVILEFSCYSADNTGTTRDPKLVITYYGVSASASMSPSVSPSLSPTMSASVSPSASMSASVSPSMSPSVSASLSFSASVSPSVSPSRSASVSPTPSASVSSSQSPSLSSSASPSSETSYLDAHQDSEGANFGFGEWANVRYRGQVFQVSLTGKLVRIGFSRDTYELTKGMRVYFDTVDADNKPVHTPEGALYSFTIANGSLIDEYGEYTLTAPLQVTGGEKYCFYLAPWDTDSNTYNYDYRDLRGVSGTTGGVVEITNTGGVWSTESLTLHYAIYIDPAASISPSASRSPSMSPSASPSFSPSASPSIAVPAEYVTASDGRFSLGGARFRYIGVNNYPLVKAEYTTEQLDSFFTCCNTDGISVVRFWAYGNEGNSSGNFRYISGSELYWREGAFASFDRVLDSARRHNVKLIAVLTDEYNYGPDKDIYCDWSNAVYGTSYTHDEFHTDSNIILWFKQFIYRLVTRVNTINGIMYGQDDTIMAWEMGNELRYTSGADDNWSTATSTRVVTMKGWYDNISTYIKSIDPNHLVGTGSVAQYYDYVADDPIHNTSYYGLDYILDHTLANVDYFDFHWYPYADPNDYSLKAYGQANGYPGTTPTLGGFLAQLYEFIDDAKANNKPVVMHEEGIDKRNPTTTPLTAYPRVDHYTILFDEFFNRGGDGMLLWHYSNLMDDNNYNIKPDGVHTGGNANGNLNDDDTSLRELIAQRNSDLAVPVSSLSPSLSPSVSPSLSPSPAFDPLRQLSMTLEVQWNGSNWIDESEYLVSTSGNEQNSDENGGAIAATLDIELENTTKRFSPNNVSSPIYAYLRPRVAIRLTLTIGGVSTRMFTGFIKNIVPNELTAICSFECYDNQVLIADAQTNGVVYEDYRSDQLMVQLATLASMTPDQYSFETGIHTVNFGYFDNKNVWEVMGELAIAERGRVFFDREGLLRFWNRNHYGQQSPIALLTQEGSITNLDYSVAEHEIKNAVIVQATPRASFPLQVVWSNGDVQYLNPYTDTLVYIPAGQTQDAWLELEDPCSSFIVPVASIDYAANTEVKGTGTDLTNQITIQEFDNYGNAVFLIVHNDSGRDVYLTKFQIRGTPVRVVNYIRVTALDEGSINEYGRQELTIENNFVDSEETAWEIAQEELYRRRDAINGLSVDIVGDPVIECGTIVTLEERKDIYKNYLVSAIDWTIDDNGFRETLTLIDQYLRPATISARARIAV